MSHLNPFELGIAILGQALVLTALVGLVKRRHLAMCWAFGLYLLTVFATDGLMMADAVVFRAEVFYSRTFWLAKEVLLTALKVAVALEIVGRVFARFPGARATVQVALYLLLGITVLSVVSVSGWLPGIEALRNEVQPRIVTGTTWLFAVVAALILWYRLPIAAMQKAILIGFVPYLIFLYLVLELRTANRWPEHGWIASLDSWAYILVLGYWARSSWQPFREIIPGRSQMPAVQRTAG